VSRAQLFVKVHAAVAPKKEEKRQECAGREVAKEHHKCISKLEG